MRRTELEAVALGLLHGPVELLPVSSSGHVEAVPWLLGWEIAGWDGARRKELAVGLHAGSLLGLALLARPPRLAPALLAAAGGPAALTALLLERRIETRLGTPPTLAAGLLAGGAALVAADQVRGTRHERDATLADCLWLGVAQTTALMPGVSRSGATLAAARTRGFARPAASRLSWAAGLPIIAAATLLKAARSRPGKRGETVAGAAAACLSTALTVRAIGLERRGPLWRWAVWRAVLAGAILAVRHNRGR
jgi:undecaprenyl-diphosphatase